MRALATFAFLLAAATTATCLLASATTGVANEPIDLQGRAPPDYPEATRLEREKKIQKSHVRSAQAVGSVPEKPVGRQ
ncbi:Uu.00g110600.m01.CDS01 [Anthostomella pinea]|uniref:Uu.00g110600.m01.CDS01 n=1 Tax=Anthostomella pinea TaxID=933095 RepID=A0AAI8V9S5_9PEZI|nr:Uu.00g110600.m01.CDS01 [Anthostomella pinea]